MRYRLLLAVLLATVSCVCQAQSAAPKNIILLIGDGMGPAHIKAYRQFVGDNPGQISIFDPYLIGSLGTDPAMEIGKVTDSAASATAYSTGTKTFNGAIAVDKDVQPLTTILQLAKQKGKATGLVVTSQVVHATPAAFAAHVESRRQYNQIADQFLDNRFQGLPYIDVILGGGSRYFVREDRDLVSEFIGLGYQYVSNTQQLKVAKTNKLLGLFAPVGLPEVLDRDPLLHPSLAQMTDKALAILSQNKQGFFLMIEGSQIDWASHDNDILGTLHEMDDFAKAFRRVVDFANSQPDTLVLLTADHETGGLSLGKSIDGKSYYNWQHQPLKQINISSYRLAEKLVSSPAETRAQLLANHLNLVLTEPQLQLLQQITDVNKAHTWVKQMIDNLTFTGWTTSGHTGVDVPLYGLGKGVELFRGHHDNTYIGQQITKFLSQ